MARIVNPLFPATKTEKPLASNAALTDQVIKQRYDVYLEEAASGKHTSQAQALAAEMLSNRGEV